MSNPVQISFGSWLKQHRRKAGISRDELAERAACSSITLQKIEAGERRPSRQLALILAQVFDIPSDEQEAFVAFARTQMLQDAATAPALASSVDDQVTANAPV